MKSKTDRINLSFLERHNGLWLLVMGIGLYLLLSSFAYAKTATENKQYRWLNELSEEASLTNLKPDNTLSGDNRVEDTSLSPDETIINESRSVDAKAIVDTVEKHVQRVSPKPEKKQPVVTAPPPSIDEDMALLVNQVLDDINRKQQAKAAEKKPENIQPELNVVVNSALSDLASKPNEDKATELVKLKAEAGNNDSSCLINKELRVAIAVGNITYIKGCLDGGLPVNTIAGTVGETLLHLAAKNGRLNIMSLLLSKKANIDSQDNSKRTPLFYAVSKNQIGAVKLLLSQGANKQIRDKFGAQAYARATNAALRNLLK